MAKIIARGINRKAKSIVTGRNSIANIIVSGINSIAKIKVSGMNTHTEITDKSGLERLSSRSEGTFSFRPELSPNSLQSLLTDDFHMQNVKT